MGRPKSHNQKAKYKALNARLEKYVILVQKVYESYNLEAAKIATSVGYDGEKPFSFNDYPITKQRVQDLLNGWRGDMNAIITKGTATEWGKSNMTQDLLADKVLSYYYGKEHGKRKRKYYQTNPDSLKAFQKRVDNGMNLSQKIWDQSRGYKRELEAAVSAGIQKGMSAVTLSKRVSKYLTDFDKLKDDYKQRYGKETDCLNCEYRSMRLARSEINMAYQTAEQERWQQMDFVVGIEIKLSKSHHNRMPHGDICDDLQGKYPKDFKWTGWHPNDMCYMVPILKTEEEFFADDDTPSASEVTNYPESMRKWIIDNQERIDDARKKGTLPYWIKDNGGMKVDDVVRYNASSLKEIIASVVGGEPTGEALSVKATVDVLDRIVEDNKGWIKGKFDGFGLELSKADNAFMRQNYWLDHETGVMHHKIGIVSREFTVMDPKGNAVRFNPMNALREAHASIANGKSLTFNQEYAVESVWHEIMHCGAVGWKNPALSEKVEYLHKKMAMEVVNQFCARRSYGRLLNRLGGKVENYKAILSDGYGYADELKSLGMVLSHYKIPEEMFYDYFKGKIQSLDYEDIFDRCVGYLSSKGVNDAENLVRNLKDPVMVSRMLDSAPK
jgi:hypothetical protein